MVNNRRTRNQVYLISCARKRIDSLVACQSSTGLLWVAVDMSEEKEILITVPSHPAGLSIVLAYTELHL